MTTITPELEVKRTSRGRRSVPGISAIEEGSKKGINYRPRSDETRTNIVNEELNE